MGKGRAMYNRTVFVTLVFGQSVANYKPVEIFQYAKGLGFGTTLNCVKCLMNVDDILDNPQKHEELCQNAVD